MILSPAISEGTLAQKTCTVSAPRRQSIVVLAVGLAHITALYAIGSSSLSKVQPAPLAEVSVSLLSAAAPPAPPQEKPTPRPPAPSKAPRPVAKPAITQTSSEPASPVAAPAAVSAPAPAPAATPANNSDSAPVSAPRFDAGYLNNPAPRYPPLSRRMGEEGKVMLRVLVSSEGQAQEVRLHVSSGSARLDEAAIDAVRNWRFVAARQGERSISGWVIVPISFRLDR